MHEFITIFAFYTIHAMRAKLYILKTYQSALLLGTIKKKTHQASATGIVSVTAFEKGRP